MKNNKHLHFLGIGGISQSALAIILKCKGYFITGSDRIDSAVVKKLQRSGIDVCVNSVSEYIKMADIIIVSAAISDDDKELVLAKKLGKKIITRSQALGLLAAQYKHVVSIAGCHGKTTTTAMIAKIFCDAGLNPTIHIGGEVDFIDGNVNVGGSDYFITEACEYMDSFLSLKSDVSVILNIQKDHLDYFKNLNNIKKSFSKFAQHTKKGGIVVYCADDPNVDNKYNGKSIGFSLSNNGVICAKNIKEYKLGKYSFNCYFLGKKLCNIQLGVFGRHNIYNAVAAICVALNFGISDKIIKSSLLDFCGVKRRFQEYPSINEARIFHDYAHHPAEIISAIKIAQSIAKGNIYVVFQPHTFSRTKLLLDEFTVCFNGVKEVFVYKTYPARERPKDGIDQDGLVKSLSEAGQKAKSYIEYSALKKDILSKLKEGDILLILGAGDIESFCDYLYNNKKPCF